MALQINPTIKVEKVVKSKTTEIMVSIPMYEGFNVKDLQALSFLFNGGETAPLINNVLVTNEVATSKVIEEQEQLAIEVKPVEVDFKNPVDVTVKPRPPKKEKTLLDKAIEEKKKESKSKSIEKVVCYKCPTCKMVHVGKLHVKEDEPSKVTCKTCSVDIDLIALKDMPKVRYQCDCGGFANFFYATECKEDEHIELRCLQCNQPKDLFYDSKRHMFREK